jgi:hypothetical protein
MTFSASQIIPMEQFGKDHWSTLAYIETVMVECAGFQVGFDGRMRQGRRNFRVIKEECPLPKRPNRCKMAIVMEPQWSTRLRNGSLIDGHDDWHCVQDLAEAGLLEGEVEPGKTLQLTEQGKQVVGLLRDHKRNGGSYSTFTVPEGICLPTKN